MNQAPESRDAQIAPAVDPAEWTNRRASDQAIRAANARRNSGRRRFVDPTTCERDYSTDELEFMQAMQEYKKRSGRMFPTWSEVLEVLRSLGYRKIENPGDDEPETGAPNADETPDTRNPDETPDQEPTPA